MPQQYGDQQAKDPTIWIIAVPEPAESTLRRGTSCAQRITSCWLRRTEPLYVSCPFDRFENICWVSLKISSSAAATSCTIFMHMLGDGTHRSRTIGQSHLKLEVRELLLAGEYKPLVNYELQLGSEAELAVPTPDHYVPLLYIAGTRTSSEPLTFTVEGVDGGSVSMLAVQVG
jgi:hypothetical protein